MHITRMLLDSGANMDQKDKVSMYVHTYVWCTHIPSYLSAYVYNNIRSSCIWHISACGSLYSAYCSV